MKRKRHSSSLSSSSQSPNNHSLPTTLFSPPKKIQPNSTNFISASFSNPNYPSSLQTMASSSVSPSPTLSLLSPSSASPPSPSLPLLSPSCVSPTPPRNLDSFSSPEKSWQEIVSSAFPAPSGNPGCVLSLSCGQCGGGSQKQDSPLQSISNSPLSASSVPPSLGWRPSPSPSPPLLSPSFVLPSPPLLSPSPVSPSPRNPNSLYRHGLISSALSTPLTSPTMEAAAANSSSCVLCGQCSGGSKRQDSPLSLSPSSPVASETAKSNGGGATPPSAAAEKRWMRVRDGLKEMQCQWMMNNISQQLEEQNNEAPVISVTEKPNNEINNQEAFQTVSSAQNVEAVQKVVQDVSIDRDGDTMRVGYMCGCGRQKQIFFAIAIQAHI
ncbi:hypothetical protein MKW98_002474 [Papaver atlanticum]|uniref:Uncharacterized protein n=1 Tax=Papaver atlanticum TaxID=357466 RepID=A0AAD4SBF2_9MAGN|nr:hypothetical protein MKW98_002474 [Papaver atlanticum]